MPSFACSSDLDRKSTRLNSSHLGISHAVFCLKNTVAVSGRTIVAGADARQIGSNDNQGAAFVYTEPSHGCNFFNDTATTEIYTLSLHDALPIYRQIAGVLRSRLPRGTAPENRSPTF